MKSYLCLLSFSFAMTPAFAAPNPKGYGYSFTSERHYEPGPGVSDALLPSANIPVPSLFQYAKVYFDPDQPLWLTSPQIDSVPVKIKIDMRQGTAQIEGSQGRINAKVMIKHSRDDDSVGYSGPSVLTITPRSNSYKVIDLNVDLVSLPTQNGRKQMLSFGTPDGKRFKVNYNGQEIGVIPTEQEPTFIDRAKLQKLATDFGCKAAL